MGINHCIVISSQVVTGNNVIHVRRDHSCTGRPGFSGGGSYLGTRTVRPSWEVPGDCLKIQQWLDLSPGYIQLNKRG